MNFYQTAAKRVAGLFRLKESPSKPQPRANPARSGLAVDYSIDGVISWFERYQYIDDALIKAGIGVDDLEKLLDDDEISSCWEKRSLAVEQRQWGLSDPESEQSIFIWEQLKPHYSTLVSSLMNSVLYGLSCPQITYKPLSGGKYGISHHVPHKTSAFAVDKAGFAYVRIDGVEHKIDDNEELRLKFFPVIHRRTSRKMAGTSLLSSLYWVVLLRTNTWEFWARYLERFGSPLLLGKAALGITADGVSSIEAMAAMLARAVNSGVAVIGNDEEAAAIGSNGNGEAFKSAQQAINERIQRRILGQTLTSGTTGVGSQALGKVHNDVRNEIVAADVSLILPALQQIVNALSEINYPGKSPPTLTIDTGANLNKDRADRDKVLFDSGVRFTRDYYIKAYEFEDEDIAEVGTSTEANYLQGTKARTLGANQSVNLSGGTDETSAGQAELDRLADEAIKAAGSPVDYEALRAVVLSAKDADDLADKLATWYDTTQPEQKYMDALGSLLFAADILGYEAIEEEHNNA